MTTHALFGLPLDLAPGWEDESVHRFVLTDSDEARMPRTAAAVPFLHAAPPGAKLAEDARTNVIVFRRPIAGGTPAGPPGAAQSLAEYVAEQRRSLAERLPDAKLVRQGSMKIGSHAAQEFLYHLALDRPMPPVAQWHVALVRGAFVYHFCATATQANFEQHKPRVRALIESWR